MKRLPVCTFAATRTLIGHGPKQQLDQMLAEYPNIRLLIIDTLQKVRAVAGANATHSNDYAHAFDKTKRETQEKLGKVMGL